MLSEFILRGIDNVFQDRLSVQGPNTPIFHNTKKDLPNPTFTPPHPDTYTHTSQTKPSAIIHNYTPKMTHEGQNSPIESMFRRSNTQVPKSPFKRNHLEWSEKENSSLVDRHVGPRHKESSEDYMLPRDQKERERQCRLPSKSFKYQI